MLDGYERYHPGFLKELMDRSLDAQRHEQELDKLRVELPFKYASKGQTLGAIIVIAAIVGASVCAFYGSTSAAVALGL